jgi:beta-lactamase class A
MCSTFKLLAAAAILARVDAQRERLDRRITFAASEVVVNSPVTKDRHGGTGMSLAELCEAAMTVSDNTAGNLLLASLGGPAGLTAFARSLGDAMTRLDRIEPELNEANPGATPRRPAPCSRTCTRWRWDMPSPPSRGSNLYSGWSATRPGTRACGPASPPGGAWGTRPGPGRTARPTTSA